MDRVEAIVVGAGVIGLAVARELAQRGLETVIVEGESKIGTGISSRNSEVLHAGLYYPTNSLKARLCVAGSRELFSYCSARGVEFNRCGKLVVATSPNEVVGLESLHKQALANGVEGVAMLSGKEARALEPSVACEAAMLSPATGVVDSHGLMLALLGDAQRNGAALALKSQVIGGEVEKDGLRLDFEGGAVKARVVINSTGLHAHSVARSISGFPSERIAPIGFAKGSYYSLLGKAPFSRLIYPMPEKGGLGVHLTFDLAGQARFGPDVEWCQDIDYSVHPERAERFYAEIRRYWPALKDGALVPAYAGIRPKLTGPDEPQDFLVQGPTCHGVPGLVNLFGMESPGLTACLAIARHVCDVVLRGL